MQTTEEEYGGVGGNPSSVETRDVSTEVASQTKCSLIKSEETLVNLRLELSQAKVGSIPFRYFLFITTISILKVVRLIQAYSGDELSCCLITQFGQV